MTRTLGIEQEFFVVHDDTLSCVRELPEAFYKQARREIGDFVERELLGSMIELMTDTHTSVRAALCDLGAKRALLDRIARAHGLALMACGAHPFADWRAQRVSPGQRYVAVTDAMAGLTRRAHVCGVHVHVGLESLGARVDVLNRIQPLLPLLIPATAASPIWRGEPMGVESYRIVAYSEGPRTGLPGRFSSSDQYEALVRAWQAAGLVDDASFCWWWIRPSAKHPTLELRISDSCADLRRIGFVCAFYRCAVVYLSRNASAFRAWSPHQDAILRENVWQAARGGMDAVLLDIDNGRSETLRAQLRAWITRLAAIADELGDLSELEYGLVLAEAPTEARGVVDTFDHAARAGHCSKEASRTAARHIAGQTELFSSQARIGHA